MKEVIVKSAKRQRTAVVLLALVVGAFLWVRVPGAMAGDPSGVSTYTGDLEGLKTAINFTWVLVTAFLGELPIFGICIGLQIIALALGCDTYKLKFGHRGANQPVKDLKSGRVYITLQNHGFAVDKESLAGHAELTQINANDNTVEGFENEYLGLKCVQYHPEASPGPWDTEQVFFDALRRYTT